MTTQGPFSEIVEDFLFLASLSFLERVRVEVEYDLREDEGGIRYA